MIATLSKNVESQNHGSLAGRVERAVAQWIFRGELTAGQKLTEQEVAERLGVSRGPVREAFRALADVGLLQIEQNRGAYVRKIDFEEAVEIHDIYLFGIGGTCGTQGGSPAFRRTDRGTKGTGEIDG